MRALILLLLMPVCAQAAILRPITELHGPVIRLSDLFDDLGAAADRPLGSAPAPGGRLVVEAAQLGAIARQFAVAWRPTSNADRTVLERPGRQLPRQAAMEAVRDALIAAGAGEDCEIALDGFASPLIPVEGDAAPLVSQLLYDREFGRFTGVLSVAGAGMDPVHIRLTGRADPMRLVPVATTRLAAGAVLAASDLRMGRVRVSLARDDVAEQPAEALGKELRHQVQPGQPLKRADLAPPALVMKGRGIQMTLESPGLTLIGQGQALGSGGLGEHIQVLNTVSRAVLEAEVTGAGQVRVSPDSAPVRPAGRGGFANSPADR